jgi:hypothetical protein
MFADFAPSTDFSNEIRDQTVKDHSFSLWVHGKTHPTTISAFQRLNQRGRLDPEPEENNPPWRSAYMRVTNVSGLRHPSNKILCFCESFVRFDQGQRV